jgi:hypothetical protein
MELLPSTATCSGATNNVIDTPSLHELPVELHVAWQLNDDTLAAASGTSIPSGSARTLSLKLNARGSLLNRGEIQAQVRVEVKRKNASSPILKDLITLLRH